MIDRFVDWLLLGFWLQVVFWGLVLVVVGQLWAALKP